MHNFRFIHTADWHVGRVFASFPEDVAEALRRARTTLPDRIAAIARSHGAGHVLVAGDTFDAPNLGDSELRALIARWAANADLVWHLIPGNHDPAGADGVLARLSALGLPDAVQVHSTPTPCEIADQVWLLPSPVETGTHGDPTAWMDHAATPEGALRLGLAHGPVTRFSNTPEEADDVIDPARVRSAGLAYLALGDWHGARQVAPGVRYAGTPEPEQFKTNAAGFVSAVTARGDVAATEVADIASARHPWLMCDVCVHARTARPIDGTMPADDVTDRDAVASADGLDADLARLRDDIDALGTQAPEAIVRVTIAGAAGVSERRALAFWRDQLAPLVRHLAWDTSRLSLRADQTTIADAFAAPQLVAVANALAARAAAVQGKATAPQHPDHATLGPPESEDAQIAALALDLLFAFASDVGAASPAVTETAATSEG